ncbi:23481_t:CDS:2 [Gigaspora rosea]|nr:23481_t:CDS:2 [Gigaspora rosea]
MLQSSSQIPELGCEFLTAEKFKKAAQQGAKALGFAFSISLLKLARVEKEGCTSFVTLQCVAYSGKISEVEKVFSEAIKAASSLEQVFSYIDRTFCQYKLQTNGALELNIASADPFILNDKRFNNYLKKFLIVYLRWYLNYVSVPLLSSSSLSVDMTVILAAKENFVPKALLHVVSKEQPIFIKRDLLLNMNKDSNCEYRALAVSLERSESKWSEKINKEISWKDGPCAFEYWIRMPQMEDIIANTYQKLLYFFYYK